MARTLVGKIFFYQKPIAITMIVIGVPMALTSNSADSTRLLLSGLFFLFLVGDKIMDERLLSLKATSMYAAMFLSYTFQTTLSELVKYHLITYTMNNINHFMILVFALANAIYYFRYYIGFNSKDE
jgi:hypothetical protein